MRKREFGSALVMVALLFMGMLPAVAGEAGAEVSKMVPEQQVPERLFAKVNGRGITQQEFDAMFTSTMRQRFYHGNVPEGQGDVVRKEVTDIVIERAVLLDEAERRGLKPDAIKIEQAIAVYDKRYAASPMWKQQRDKLLPGLKAQLVQQDLLDQMDKQLREVAQPSAVDVRTYYDQHRELFTEPEKLHLLLILLKVDPSSPDEVWKSVREKSQVILQRLKSGADFAEEARANSADPSAANGGDLGYVHRGMLPEAMQGRIDQAKLGEAEGPLTVLEGVALYRLEKRVAPKLREFADVEARASELLQRDKKAEAKKTALARLHDAAKIEVMSADKPEQK